MTGRAPKDKGPKAVRILRCFLVEDHAVVRHGLRLVIDGQPDVEVIGEAGSLAQALAIRADPDVIITDLVLGDAQGAEVVAGLRERFPRAHILVLSMMGAQSDIHSSLAAGARGYIPKEAASEDLVEAIHKVGAGEEYLHPALGASLLRRSGGSPAPVEGIDSLTPREIEVLRLLALGHTNSEIADLLGVSPRTVEAHRAQVTGKLGAHSRADLVRIADMAGLTLERAHEQRPTTARPVDAEKAPN